MSIRLSETKTMSRATKKKLSETQALPELTSALVRHEQIVVSGLQEGSRSVRASLQPPEMELAFALWEVAWRSGSEVMASVGVVG
jgi:hypothetical protein